MNKELKDIREELRDVKEELRQIKRELREQQAGRVMPWPIPWEPEPMGGWPTWRTTMTIPRIVGAVSTGKSTDVEIWTNFGTVPG